MDIKEMYTIVQIDHSGRAYHIAYGPSDARDIALELTGIGHDLVHLIDKVTAMMMVGEDDWRKAVFHIGLNKYGCRLVHVELEKNDFSRLTDAQWAKVRQGLQAVGEMFACYNSLMMQEDSFHLVWRYEWA